MSMKGATIHFQAEAGGRTACGLRPARVYISADRTMTTCRNCKYNLVIRAGDAATAAAADKDAP